MPWCPVWPARKRGKGSAGSKLSFMGIGYAFSTGTADRYPAIAVQKRRNLGLTWAAWELLTVWGPPQAPVNHPLTDAA